MKNVFHKITWQALKKNRARTIVTIIGVILSAAMITAVTTFIASLQNSLIQREIAVSGGWHVKFTDVDPAFIEKIMADKEVESAETIKTEYSESESGYDALVTLKSPGKVYRFAEKTAGGASYEYNRALLRLYGVSASDGYNAVFYSLGGILIALIMVGSVLLIYNSFAISVSERSRQFGILASVGATKKQLRKAVLFEGVCIGAAGIPLGIAAGIGGIGVTLHLISDITKYMFSSEVPLTLSPSWPSIAVAAAVSAATILISAYIPARRAFSQSAIDIIRQSSDVKIKANEVRTSKLAGLLFGLEGTLALKNFKRNRKRYRSTVISLFVSVTLFVAASAFGMYLRQGTEMTIGDYGFDLAFGVSQGSYHLSDEELLRLYDRMNGASGVTAGAYTTSLQRVGYVSASEFTEKFLQSDDGGVIAEIPEGRENSAARVHMTLRFVDDATYGKYLEALGLSAAEYGVEKGRLPAVAKKTGYDSARQRTVAFDVFQNSSVTIPLAPVSAPAGDAYPAMTDKLWFYPRIFIFALFAIIFEFLIMRLPSGYIWTVIPLTQLAPALAYLLFIFVFKNMFVPIKVNVNRKIIGKSVLAIVVPVLLGGAVYIIGNMFKIDNNLNENIRNFLPNGGALLLYLIIGSIGEEIGWRGFLKPTLEKRHSVLLSNVIVGIIWALWHIDRYTAGSIYWATFLPMIVSFSIIMAIILKDTMNNMIISVLIHTMFNLSFMIFLGNSFMDTRVMIITSVVLSLAAIVVIIANREYFTIRSGIK